VRHILDDAGVTAVVHGAEHAGAVARLRPLLPGVTAWVDVDGPDDVPAACGYERLLAASPKPEGYPATYARLCDCLEAGTFFRG